jgi:hypothetical protein
LGTDKLKNGMPLPATTRLASRIIKRSYWIPGS